MTALLLFCLLFFCYSVFFTSNLFLCLSVTLSFLRATCFFVLLLLCLFYVQFVSLSFCYSVFFTSNLFLCPSVTLSFLRAICFFVFLLLCLFYEQLVSLSFRYSVFFRATCFFVLLLLCLFYVQFVSLSFCYSVFFTSNLSTRSLVNLSTCYPIVKNIKYCIYNNEYSKEYVYICCRLYEVNDSLLIGPKNKT